MSASRKKATPFDEMMANAIYDPNARWEWDHDDERAAPEPVKVRAPTFEKGTYGQGGVPANEGRRADEDGKVEEGTESKRAAILAAMTDGSMSLSQGRAALEALLAKEAGGEVVIEATVDPSAAMVESTAIVVAKAPKVMLSDFLKVVSSEATAEKEKNFREQEESWKKRDREQALAVLQDALLIIKSAAEQGAKSVHFIGTGGLIQVRNGSRIISSEYERSFPGYVSSEAAAEVGKLLVKPPYGLTAYMRERMADSNHPGVEPYSARYLYVCW